MTLSGRLLELRLRPWPAALVTLPMIALIGAADTNFTVEVRLTLLYLLPIALAAWTGGRATGVSVALIAAVTQLVVDLHVSHSLGLSLWNLAADLLVYVGAALLLDAVRRSLAEAHRDARTDPLTGLANLRAFRDVADVELARSRRYGHPLSLALLDLDHFKQVNDTYGHGVGDDVLRATAQHLQEAVRCTDLVARVGGDEFVVLFPETDSDAAETATRHLGSSTSLDGHDVGFSVGLASYRDPPTSVDELLAAADRAMYARKRARRSPT
jgi:diguanylate cyclase (GGDEF)-like protein